MKLNIFIKRPILASVISIIITLCGLVALFNLPVTQFPNISPPSISIAASYPGANAVTAAKVVAAQIENQLNGVSNLSYMATSTSSTGSINIVLTYDVGTDLNYAINEVLNRLYAAMPLLPSVVQKMGVVARKSSPDALMYLSFYADPYIDPKYVSNYLQRTVENDLLLVNSVGTIGVFGTGSYAIRIWVDPNKMQKYGISVNDVQNAIFDQNEEFTVGRSNAVPDTKSHELMLNITGSPMYSTPEQFANIVLRNKNNETVRIKDIARVELGSENYDTVAEVNYRDEHNKFKHYPCTIMSINLLPGANQLAAKQQILDKLNEDAKRFPYGLKYKIVLDNSKFVAASVKNVTDTMMIAFVLVAIIILLFLNNWRASFIAICTVPVSIIGTMACLYIFGFSLNTLSLFALILAIGIVVDDAIVIVENIERLRMEHPEYKISKVVELTMEEVFGAIVAIVLVLSVVFIPVMGLPGFAGIMYRQFAVTIACSVVLSGICALTFTPALSYLVLKNYTHKEKKLNKFDIYFGKLTNFYLKVAKYFINSPKIAILIWFMVLGSTYGIFSFVHRGFVPPEDQGLIFATVNLPSSSSLTQTQKTSTKIIQQLTKNPNIETVTSVNGYDFLDSGNLKTYAASFFIVLRDWDKRIGKNSTADDIIKTINMLGMRDPGMVVRAFNQPPIRGLSVTAGAEFYVEDKVIGDPSSLQKIVDGLIKRLRKHKEIGMTFQMLDTNVLEMSVVPDIPRAKFYGVNLNGLYNAIQTIYSDNNVNWAYIMQDLVWVILQADYPYRTTIDKLSSVYIHGSDSTKLVPVSSVVKVTSTHDAQVIQRFNDYIASKVVVNPAPGYAMGDVLRVIQEEASTNLPKGYDYAWYGTSYQLTKSTSTSTYAFAFSIIMIFLVLSALYGIWRLPLVVLMGVPFALFGAAVILLVSHNNNDLYFQISLIALLGLSAKNIILLVEFALQHFNAGYDVVESALYALEVRFRPVVMTSVTFIAGTIPLVIAHGAGANAQHSVGIGIIGGILGSVFLSTVLTPAYFVIFMKNFKRKVKDED